MTTPSSRTYVPSISSHFLFKLSHRWTAIRMPSLCLLPAAFTLSTLYGIVILKAGASLVSAGVKPVTHSDTMTLFLARARASACSREMSENSTKIRDSPGSGNVTRVPLR
ncbi:MAG: hypothetical protein ACK55Z_05520, partial [bacterium]